MAPAMLCLPRRVVVFAGEVFIVQRDRNLQKKYHVLLGDMGQLKEWAMIIVQEFVKAQTTTNVEKDRLLDLVISKELRDELFKMAAATAA